LYILEDFHTSFERPSVFWPCPGLLNQDLKGLGKDRPRPRNPYFLKDSAIFEKQ
jgi:hypothetical protein